jgi:hypothetical protein
MLRHGRLFLVFKPDCTSHPFDLFGLSRHLVNFFGERGSVGAQLLVLFVDLSLADHFYVAYTFLDLLDLVLQLVLRPHLLLEQLPHLVDSFAYLAVHHAL